jgi:hypothetical protein
VTADVAGLKAGLDGELREFLEEFIAACPTFIATYFNTNRNPAEVAP